MASCRKSDVWKLFEQEGASVSCSLCQTKLSYHGSTSSMKEHLKRKHPVDFENQAEKDVPRKQQKLDVFTKKSSCSTERAAISSNLIAGVIIKDVRPINMVNGAGFQQLMAYLEPAYRLPSDTHFTHLIERMYASVKAEVVKVLSNIDF